MNGLWRPAEAFFRSAVGASRERVFNQNLLNCNRTFYVCFLALGTECEKLERFHLYLWSEEIYDSDWLEESTPSDYFPCLKDVKVKAEDYVTELPLHLFNNILRSTSKSLTICQVLLHAFQFSIGAQLISYYNKQNYV